MILSAFLKGNYCLVGEGVAGCEGLLEEGYFEHLIELCPVVVEY